MLTPLKAGATKSTIEDSFADEIKDLNLGGKTFNANSTADTSAHFGKHILSQYIRENAASAVAVAPGANAVAVQP